MKWVDWKLTHRSAYCCQLSFVIKSTKIIKLLEGSHQCLWSRWVHVIEVNDIVDSEFLEIENHCCKVRSLNLRVRVLF